MFENIKIWWHQGKQYIPDVTNAKLPGIFRGRPVITRSVVDEAALVELCPTGAITGNPVCIDLVNVFLWRMWLQVFPKDIFHQ